MGIPWFGLETRMGQDPKVFDLKFRYGMPEGASEFDKGAAFAAYGRLVELLTAIYGDGFAMELTPQVRLALSERLGLSFAELDRFVETCVDCGIFDRGMYVDLGVLTSRGIQKRYYLVSKRRKGEIPDSMRQWVLPGSPLNEQCSHDANTTQTGSGQGEGEEDTAGEHEEGSVGANSPTSKSKSKGKGKKDIVGQLPDETYERIVDHLNEVAVKNFRPTTTETRLLIAKLIVEEGYTEQDLITVIDNKADSWVGDPKMDRYMQPSTLFRASKFEGYLNERRNPSGTGSEYSGAF